MFNTYLEQKLKYSLFLTISVLSFFSLYHKIHHMPSVITNLVFIMPIILIAVYIYVDQFLLEQLSTATRKLLIGLFVFSIVFASEYRSRHSHYFPDVLLSFVIGFGLLIWIFTFKKNSITKSQTLSDVYDFTNNSFNLMRFILASMVFLLHAGLFSNLVNLDLINTLVPYDIGRLSVYGFFAISGFFMVQSLDNSKTSKEFLLKRVLRIFPLFLTLVVVGWIFYGHHVQEIRGQVFLQAFNGVVNIGVFNFGSSWTLKIEFLSYLVLLVLYTISNKNRIFILIATCSFITLDLILYLHGTNSFYYTRMTLMNTLHDGKGNYAFFGLFPCFMVGSLMYLYKDKIICNKHVVLCFFLAYLFIILIIGNNNPTVFTILQIFIIPFLVIACGSLLKIQLWTKFGDYSYGIYLIHFPVLGLSIFRIFHNPTIELIFLYAIILALAILSWHIIEKPALRLKRYL